MDKGFAGFSEVFPKVEKSKGFEIGESWNSFN